MIQPQARYRLSDVRRALRAYGQLVAGDRLAQREDRPHIQRQRQEDAPWTASAILKADIECALKALPFEVGMITFEVLAEGRTIWYVGQFFQRSPAEIGGIVEQALAAMCDYLNGHDIAPQWGH